MRRRIQLLPVSALVHQRAQHALLVLEQLARLPELDLPRLTLRMSVVSEPVECGASTYDASGVEDHLQIAEDLDAVRERQRREDARSCRCP